MERGRERGLMRASARAATLSNNGVRWLKYNCTATRYTDVWYTEDAWEIVTTYTATSITGARSYNFNSNTGNFSDSGGSVTFTTSNTGTVYSASGDSVSYERIVASGVVGVYSKGSTRHSSSYTEYAKGTYVGAIYADEGIYPDAEANYVYVTTFTDSGVTYTVMRNGSTYYCYCKG